MSDCGDRASLPQLTTLGYEVQDSVAVVTLRRPESHNAFNHRMIEELAGLWEHIKSDDSAVVVIVTGEGERAFCTGMDLGDIEPEKVDALFSSGMEDSPLFRMTALQNRCWKPVITAVNGMVCGGGFHFLADSDIVIAADHATFFDTHVKVGLIAGLEPVGLARRIPLDAVFKLALLGGSERMSAGEALQCGLVGELTSSQDLMPRAMDLARKIALHSPTALAETKKAIWRSKEMGLGSALAETWQAINAHRAHPDPDEGIASMQDGRPPVWASYTD